MNKALPIMLAVAALSAGAPASLAFAQDPAPAAAAPAAQASDPEAAATDAYTKTFKTEADAEKKFAAGKSIVAQYPGTKAAESVAYAYLFDTGTDPATLARKYEVSKAYYDATVAGGKAGAYVEYALGNLATLEKDPAKLDEYGRTYMQKYPGGKLTPYVKAAMAASAYKAFDAAVNEKRWADAIRLGEPQFGSENEFIYAYRLAYSGLTDETATGAKSQFVGKASAWADRAAQYIESGKVPPNTDPAKLNTEKPKMLAALYKTKGVDTYLRIAGTNPTTAEALQPAIDALKNSMTKNEKDSALQYFLSQAYAAQYAVYSNQFTALSPDQQNGDAGKALLEKVNAAADTLIDSYVHAIAYAGETSPLASQVRPQLEELWKFRHPDTPNGWQDEVKKVNGGAATASTPGK